jgi:hypothetical protein
MAYRPFMRIFQLHRGVIAYTSFGLTIIFLTTLCRSRVVGFEVEMSINTLPLPSSEPVLHQVVAERETTFESL